MQADLFEKDASPFPDGFRYSPNVVPEEMQANLVQLIERQFEATDAIVSAVDVDVVGVNYYPHTARTSLVKVLLATWRRYRKPIMVSETSWHDGHPVHHSRYPGFSKGRWLQHVLQQVDIAAFHGAVIAGVCWYPIVDCPPWHRPFSGDRWSHGLIRSDLSVDPDLSAELASVRARVAA